MISKVVHAVLPLAVITAATVLTVTGHLSTDAAVAMISASGGLGAVAVAAGTSPPSR